MKKDKENEFEWVEQKPAELEEIIVQLSNSGTSKSEIGSILRDQYGVPDLKKVIGKTVSEVLAEHKISETLPEDLLNLIRKSVLVEKHREKNKKDFTAKYGYKLTVAKINKLVQYYKGKKKLPSDWKFSAENARLLMK